MEDRQRCPECGTAWKPGETCQDHFYQMLYWENEDNTLGVVHHLMVLCYHLQHPSLYAPEGLAYGMGLLKEFVALGTSPAEIRQRSRDKVDSGKRNWKIKGTPAARGSYPHPVRWQMTAADVVRGGMENYIENVEAWARLVWEQLQTSGNLPQAELKDYLAKKSRERK